MDHSSPADVRLLVAYLRPERRVIAALTALLVVAMVLPLAGPVLVGRFVDAALAGDDTAALVRLAGLFLAATLTGDALQLVVTWLSVRLAWRVGNSLRSDLCCHALSLDLDWHGSHSPGQLIERIDGDIDAVTRFSSTAVLQLVGNAILVVGVLLVSAAIDWRASILIGLTVAAAVGVMVRLRRIAVPYYDEEREVQAHLYGDVEERLGGLEDLRANGAGRWAEHRLQQHSADWWRTARRAAARGDGAISLAGAVFGAGSVLVLALGVWANQQGTLSVGSVLTLLRFSQLVSDPLWKVAEQLAEAQKAVAGTRRAARLLATTSTLTDGDGPALPAGPLEVELRGVTFGYGTGKPVLDQVDLRVPAGTTLGVVGRTGSGKTTVGRLVARLWDTEAGAVLVGGVDVRSLGQADLRRHIGVVTQEVELLRAPLRDNLTMFGSIEADDAQLTAALHDVGLGGWLGSLPGGLDEHLDGEAELSAGEGQLLAFARVLLADPAVVILDEASSRLDPETEARLTVATDQLLAGRTALVIAHRLATLDRVDQIAVLDHGRLVEHGDRGDLAADPTSRYHRLLASSLSHREHGPMSSETEPQPETEPETASSYRFAWRILRADPRTWLISLGMWVAFFTLPIVTGLLLKAILDRLAPGADSGIWVLVALLGGVELGRWLLLLPAIVLWHGAWVFWHTVHRVNAIRSLGQDPGPVTGRLPGSPGEAVSRFRDDARDVAQVLDVWLDMVAAVLASVGGVVVLSVISPAAAFAMVLPIALVLFLGQALASRLKHWRLVERQATAGVTGFIGDAFGAIGAVKVAAAEGAVLGRFEALGHARAAAARRDQVGTQVAQVLGGITANAGLGLALVLTAPALRRGELTVGDVGLFTTYATLVAGLPRVTARWSAWQRQAEVSAARLGRLMPGHDPDRASAATETFLRHGPPPFVPDPVVAPHRRTASHRLDRLSVRDLSVRLDHSHQIHHVDLDVARGQLVVITGPVGSGKSVLVRALLGLVPRTQGTIRWNGEVVDDPSTVFVPPRVAYVPQVPRLFSEELASTVLLGVHPGGLDRALTLARLDDDLQEMAHGRRTLVGPKGVRLSGGQVQRAAAARAFVREPELLVVDDLSSALDVATETALWDGLFDGDDGDRTVLAISHRPRVLDRADVVISLKKP